MLHTQTVLIPFDSALCNLIRSVEQFPSIFRLLLILLQSGSAQCFPVQLRNINNKLNTYEVTPLLFLPPKAKWLNVPQPYSAICFKHKSTALMSPYCPFPFFKVIPENRLNSVGRYSTMCSLTLVPVSLCSIYSHRISYHSLQ